MQSFLKTTLRNVLWFKNAEKHKELQVKPPFQRNPVWVDRQKSYLIDSILCGYPIPEIYMQEIVDENGNGNYIIVDGQQRTRAVLEFIEDKFSIDPKDSPDYADMCFSDLTSEDKKKIFEYNFVVRVLPEMRDTELRAIFQRLNKNVVALNKQELRQATYWGPFIKSMNKVSDKEYWSKIDVFTANDIRRMLDVEFVSELATAMIHGIQNKKQNLDKYYQIYEEEYEHREQIESDFDTVLSEMLKVLPEISRTRWSKKSDFYTLFICFHKNIANLPLSSDKRASCREKIIQFGSEVDRYVQSDPEKAVDFGSLVKKYGAGTRATTDLGSRKHRHEALSELLIDVWNPANKGVNTDC